MGTKEEGERRRDIGRRKRRERIKEVKMPDGKIKS